MGARVKVTRDEVVAALRQSEGSVAGGATHLGVSIGTMYRLIRDLGLDDHRRSGGRSGRPAGSKDRSARLPGSGRPAGSKNKRKDRAA